MPDCAACPRAVPPPHQQAPDGVPPVRDGERVHVPVGGASITAHDSRSLPGMYSRVKTRVIAAALLVGHDDLFTVNADPIEEAL